MTISVHRMTVKLLTATAALACVIAPSQSIAAKDATAKDEARWRTEDSTPQARYRTMSKEAAAAYKENLAQCKTMPASERATCTKDAKAGYRRELADAKETAGR